MLVANNLCKWYGDQLVLRNLSLSVMAGEILALTGPNGAGKSSLLSILATYTAADRGTLELKGVPYNAGNAGLIRQSLGVVFHATSLYNNLTAQENLLFFARIFGIINANECAQRYLKLVNLEERAHSLVKNLSNGMQKRLALARAMMTEPQLLLLDEPEAGLDKESFKVLVNLLREHQSDAKSVVLATHSTELISELNAREVRLQNGETVGAEST